MDISKQLALIKAALPGNVKLIAVSKTHPISSIQEAYQTGQRDFGENKVQEMASKAESLPVDIKWHLIGHLQTNKVKYIAPFVHLIHSVDSLKLLQEIDKQAAKFQRTINCLMQVYIANEETKFGFDPEEVRSIIKEKHLAQFKNIHVIGLMGMASFTDDQAQIENEFNSLKVLFDELKQVESPNWFGLELSIGMSSDYKLAINSGSTMIRIGSSIFGSRNYS